MPGGGDTKDDDSVARFIARWSASEGAERAAYAQFLSAFCDLIGVEAPLPPTRDREAVTYRFEYPVRFHDGVGGHTTGRIDLYKKGSFVLEAKQSRWQGQSKEVLPGAAGVPDEEPTRTRGRAGADRGSDVLMLNARNQSERYAKALPVSHGWPPFLIICDVGHCFEFYADFSGRERTTPSFQTGTGFASISKTFATPRYAPGSPRSGTILSASTRAAKPPPRPGRSRNASRRCPACWSSAIWRTTSRCS